MVLNIVYLPVEGLTPYIKNPRKNDKAVDIVARSIKEYGFLVPIIIDKDKIIVAGHTRLKAAYKLGLKEVPTIMAENLTEEQIKGFRIMDNKAQEYSEWDNNLLKQELTTLKELGFDLDDTGFNERELEDFFKSNDRNDPMKEPVYKINKGDIYIIGNHKLICGDSRDKDVYKKLVGEDRIKLVFSSPPYNMGSNPYANTGGMDYKDDLSSKDYINLNLEVINNILPYLKGYVFWNLSYNMNSRWEYIEIFYRIIKETNLKFLENIIWDKGVGLPIISPQILRRTYEQILLVGTEEEIQKELDYIFVGSNLDKVFMNKKGMRAITNYWKITPNGNQTEVNKATFPLELSKKGIMLLSDKGDTVIDPFGGLGTTLIACEELGRKCLIIEQSEKYCSYIIERWENLTGQKAIKLNS